LLLLQGMNELYAPLYYLFKNGEHALLAGGSVVVQPWCTPALPCTLLALHPCLTCGRLLLAAWHQDQC
jgi:hypothetical protein